MSTPTDTSQITHLRNECSALRVRLTDAEETLHAIQGGQVDALMITSDGGHHVLTLEGADSAYRTLIEDMNEGIVTIGVDGLILYSNRRFAALLNMPLTQVVSSRIEDWIEPADVPRFDALKQRAAHNGNGRDELMLWSGDAMIPVQLSINAVRFDGRDAFSCMVTDLTEQKLALLVLEQASEAIIVCNDKGIIIRASDAAAALCPGDVLGRLFSVVFCLRQADGMPLDIGGVLQGARAECEATLADDAGQRVFLVNAGPLSGRQPDMRGAIVTMTDITARKQAENALLQSVERYRALVLATTQIIWSADPTGRATDANAGWRAYTGQSQAQMDGFGWLTALHPDDVAATMHLWQHALATGVNYVVRYRLRRHDGAYRYHLLCGVPVRGQDGSIREWVGTATDVHDQQQAELRMLLEHGVVRLLAESTNLNDTLRDIVTLMCDTFHWRCGVLWSVTGASQQLVQIWPAPMPAAAQPAVNDADIAFASVLAHDVVRTQAPVRMVSSDANDSPSGDGNVVLAFPLGVDADVLGVLCVFGREIAEPDAALLQTVATIGRHIGVFFQKKHAESVLLLRERALEASSEAVFIARCEGDANLIDYVNPAFEKISGYSEAQVLGQDLLHIEQQLCRDQDLMEIRSALRDKRVGHAITHSYRQDGTRFWSDLHIAPVHGEGNQITHFVGIQNDISQSMRYQTTLEYQANHDALTGLPNRNLLNDRLRRAIGSAKRNQNLMAIVFVDLDHFKLINDTLGHDVGDVVLKAIATRLTSCLRDADTAARPGGDEFLLILVDQESIESITVVILRLLEMIAQPIQINGRKLHVTCSIGISIYLQDGEDASTLLKNADTAMYHAKENGRNNFQFFDAGMNLRVHERFTLEASLRQAMADNNLMLHYQPQFDIHTGEIVGVEALLRWNHAELGMVAPSRFIPIAEDSGLIIAIGEWVLRNACAQNKAWQNAGLPAITMAVNLSARQFKHDNLAHMVTAVLAETGLAARYLELELTESLALEDSDMFMSTLTRLKALGLQLTIDDFGTGYSSLSYLKNLPLDRLKIDISFIHDIVRDSGDAAIAQTIVMLGHSLRLKVLAEGVETTEQLAILRAQGCDEIQGFYFSEALPAGEMEDLLRTSVGRANELLRL